MLQQEKHHHFNFENGEVLNINKPEGLTSFDVVKKIRKWANYKRVGHAGTLDPFATGVLIVCTGKATKRSSEIMAFEKIYRGVVHLGRQTNTDDKDGDIIEIRPVPEFSYKDIQQACQKFIGEIDQIPPLYAAIKIQGKPLYWWARQGIHVSRQPRKVHIYEIRIERWENSEIELWVRCSKGTYIRALARDIGNRLNTGGYLKSLCRLSVGPYRIENAYSMEVLGDLLNSNAYYL